MTTAPLSCTLTSPEQTAQLAVAVGSVLDAGDCILLYGPIGSGKTHFCRHLIQSRLPFPEDVPSPTFTLVQTYHAGSVEIWHTDLYRITALEEVDELGLTEAFESAICLVEWPEKLGPLIPDTALSLTFEADPVKDDTTRRLTIRWSDSKWDAKLGKLDI